jgi:chloramphenicol-sensitive protein RarD
MTDPARSGASASAPGGRSERAGVACAVGAFFLWGAAPLYFRALRGVSAFETIAQRVLWSFAFMLLLVPATRGFAPLRAAARQPRLLARLGLSGTLVASNWLTFVWAVNAGRVLETSLGYYITPLVNVVLGFLFLGERLRRLQWVAVLLALAGVVNQIVLLGQLPWVSLVLAVTFGCYGLLRKQIPVDPLTGLLIETALIAPLALGFLLHLAGQGRLALGHLGRGTDVLLVLLGVVTAVPLLLFAAGAQRLRLATVGFLQYLAPSMTFVLAVWLFGEPLGLPRLVTFVLIWTGIALYYLSIRLSRAASSPEARARSARRLS